MPSISVVIADQGKAARAACRNLLDPERDIRVVGEARSGLDVVAAAEKLRPRVLLLDLSLFNGNGTSVLSVIRRRSPKTRVLLLAKRAPEARALEALSHGALGYLEKDVLRTYLPRAVRAVNAGEAWVPRTMVARIIERLARLTFPA